MRWSGHCLDGEPHPAGAIRRFERTTENAGQTRAAIHEQLEMARPIQNGFGENRVARRPGATSSIGPYSAPSTDAGHPVK
jgi:hypothetical protein